MACTREDLGPLLVRPWPAQGTEIPAQAFGTGPTARFSAMPDMFGSMMFAAREKLVITTPYFVPNDFIRDGLCAAARRGVETTLVVPARNDSMIVAAASRSYYAGLLDAGVRIHEFSGGLLHTKSLTVDGQVTLIGSANMDRRSFDLNYENNILLYSPELTSEVCALQQRYISSSTPVSLESVNGWSMQRRLWNNVLGLLGPIL